MHGLGLLGPASTCLVVPRGVAGVGGGLGCHRHHLHAVELRELLPQVFRRNEEYHVCVDVDNSVQVLELVRLKEFGCGTRPADALQVWAARGVPHRTPLEDDAAAMFGRPHGRYLDQHSVNLNRIRAHDEPANASPLFLYCGHPWLGKPLSAYYLICHNVRCQGKIYCIIPVIIILTLAEIYVLLHLHTVTAIIKCNSLYFCQYHNCHHHDYFEWIFGELMVRNK